MELVSALKEGVASRLLAVYMVKTLQVEGIFIVDVEENFLDKSKKKIHAPISTSLSGPIFPLSRYIQNI